MKKFTLLFSAMILLNVAFGQTFQADFLDGVVMFKLENPVSVAPAELNRRDQHSYSLTENLANYPALQQVLLGVNVVKLERPSYYAGKPELMSIYRLHLGDFARVDEIVRKLASLPGVVYAEKEPIYKIDFVPNDTQHTGTNKWYHTLVGSEAAWDISLGSNSVKVAIVDNAVFCGHSDLTTFAQRDVSDNDNDATPPSQYTADQAWSHGTHCGGLATADINNANGIASLGGNVELIGVKATPNSGNSNQIFNSYEGVQWACLNGANVVSMSFGSTQSNASFQALINSFPNIVFLAAAGNDGNSTPNYPGAYNNVICVGSVDANDSRSSFSNFNGGNPFVDIASPGGFSNGGLLSTVYTTAGTGLAKMGGTSMATPFAAGLVGLMLSLNPGLSPSTIQSCLINSGVNINQNIGPRINALAALQCVQATLNGDPIPAFTGNPLSLIEGQSSTFTDNSANGGNAITNWTWSFPGGTPSSFVGQTPPAIQYATAGAYDVTLTVTNSQSTQSLTKTNYVNVSTPPSGGWIVQNSGFTQASRGIGHISIANGLTVWATAYDGSGGTANVQQFTKTTNGGTTWTPGTINVGNAGLGIAMIHALDANTAWTVAYPNAANQTGGVWKTTNGGSTWTRQNSASYSNAASFSNVVHFWDANEGFVQGDPINGEYELYRTTDGGANWVAVPGANIPNPTSGEYGYVRGIEVVGNSVWYTTNKGRLYHSTDRGLNWVVYQTPLTDFANGSVSFKDATTGIIVSSAGTVYKTTNSGATWGTVTTTGTVFSPGLCWVEGTNTVFTTGAAAPAGSSYSNDGGTTWNIIDNQQHLYVEFSTPSIGWSGWFNTDATTNGMWKWDNTSGNLTCDFQANPSTSCVGSSVQYTDLSSGSTPTSWSWSFPGGTPATSTMQNPTVSYATAGSYSVTLTVNDGSGPVTKTDAAHVTVQNQPATPSSVAGPNNPCEGASVTYSVTNIPGATFNWTLPNGWTGTSSTNSITTTVVGTAPGAVSVTTSNSCGASSPQSMNVTVCNASLGENGISLLEIFPNPTKSVLTINGLEAAGFGNETEAKIMDVAGKVVYTTTLSSTKNKLDVSQLTNGVYFLQIGQDVKTVKFIKE